MTAAATIAHGGRLDAARRDFPHAPQPWVDLSTGINPRAFPLPALAAETWTRLPDEAAFAALGGAARAAYHAPSYIDIIPGAGAQAFIQILPRLFASRRVGVLGFTYAEHAACWTASGADVRVVETLEALTDFDAAVIVNPNNPDGRIIAPEKLAALGRDMSRKGSLLIVDESFMDFTSAQSVVPLMGEGMIVLRSLGKAYGLAGLRLGFALCSGAQAASMRAALGPWAVSGPALAIGAQALADAAWRETAAALCARDAARLDALLAKAGFEACGGTSLFRLVRHPQAAQWFAQLCDNGVLTRPFAERPDWLRFGLPGAEAEWRRLSAALENGL